MVPCCTCFLKRRVYQYPESVCVKGRQWRQWRQRTHVVARVVHVVPTVQSDVDGVHLCPAICGAGLRQIHWGRQREES